MSLHDEPLSPFEKRTRALLEESLQHVDGRVRSRLNQARHAALAAVAQPRRRLWQRPLTLAPAAGALAAIVVAVMFWTSRPEHLLPINESTHTAVEDLDLVADSDTLELLEDEEGGGFYEWAVAQADAGADASG